MKLYNLIFLILISICLIAYNQPFVYDVRKKPLLFINTTISSFLNTTNDLIVERSNKINVDFEIKYRKITMV